MKFQCALPVIIVLALAMGCSDQGTQGPDIVAPEQLGIVSLSFSDAPAEITTVVARLTRPGHTPRELQLTISDSGQSASGNFNNVAIGLWRLRVEALDDGGAVRYAGETNVEVLPQQVSQVTLHLLPTSGGIHIVVTWGSLPIPGLVAYYPFNGNANDASGNGNHGLVHGAVLTADRHGNPNKAYLFDGIDDMITIPSSPSLNPVNQLTITLWVRVDSITDNYTTVLHKGGPIQHNPWRANREYYVELKDASQPNYLFKVFSAGDGQGEHGMFSTHISPARQWVFVATVINRTTHSMRIYVNGVFSGETFDPYTSFNNNNHPLTLGRDVEDWPHSPLMGALDEVRIYNRALTQTEIHSLYTMD